jgi:hypothetical protein
MSKAAMLLLVLLAGACTTQKDAYEERINSIPDPSSDPDRQQKCAWLSGELAAQRKVIEGSADVDGDLTVVAARALARSKIHLLEMRADDFHCSSVTPDPRLPALTVPPWIHAAPPASVPVPVAPPAGATAPAAASPIEACIAACKANTPRTPEQCFDACNH